MPEPNSNTQYPILIPEPIRCLGRKREEQELLSLIFAESNSPILIYGASGIGKSTLAQSVLSMPQVIKHYGNRRFFVDCSNVQNGKELSVQIVEAIGEELSLNNEVTLHKTFTDEPAVFLLDNFGSFWDVPTNEMQEWMQKYTDYTHILFIITLRCNTEPLNLGWRPLKQVMPLKRAEAKKLFCLLSGVDFSTDPLLDSLLDAVRNHPLAVTLLGQLARSGESLKDIRECWQKEQSRSPKVTGVGEKDYNLRISVMLSINSPYLNDDARRLLSILAMFAVGIHRDHLAEAVSAQWRELSATLVDAGLAYWYQNRLRLYSAVRDFVLPDYPVAPQDIVFICEYYNSLAASNASKARSDNDQEARIVLFNEIENIKTILAIFTLLNLSGRCVALACAIASLSQVGCMDTRDILYDVHRIAKEVGTSV